MLFACARCGAHLRVTEAACPHCGGAVLPSGRTATGLILALTLAGCPLGDKDSGEETADETGAYALYGVAYVDDDGDGYDSYADCDDTNADINPEAKETAGDGVDSNCDGEDDT